MTQTTDKNRAEFEAWALTESKWLHSREPSWMFHINECGDYAHLDVQQAFEAWQASRRAQVVPQGYESGAMSGNRVTLFFDNQKNAESWFDGFCDGYDASAPQPPEAAPVQLQESISKVLEDCRSRAIDYATCPSPYNNTRMETAFQSLEHQVRQLLAAHAHGITQAKQGGKQP